MQSALALGTLQLHRHRWRQLKHSNNAGSRSSKQDADKAANQKKIVASQLLKKLSPSLEQLRQQCTLAKQKSLPCANAIAKLDEASAIQTELEKFTTGVGSESDPVMQKEVRV